MLRNIWAGCQIGRGLVARGIVREFLQAPPDDIVRTADWADGRRSFVKNRFGALAFEPSRRCERADAAGGSLAIQFFHRCRAQRRGDGKKRSTRRLATMGRRLPRCPAFRPRRSVRRCDLVTGFPNATVQRIWRRLMDFSVCWRYLFKFVEAVRSRSAGGGSVVLVKETFRSRVGWRSPSSGGRYARRDFRRAERDGRWNIAVRARPEDIENREQAGVGGTLRETSRTKLDESRDFRRNQRGTDGRGRWRSLTILSRDETRQSALGASHTGRRVDECVHQTQCKRPRRQRFFSGYFANRGTIWDLEGDGPTAGPGGVPLGRCMNR